MSGRISLRTCIVPLVGLLACSTLVGCTEDGINLPDQYNTLKYRQIDIRFSTKQEAPFDEVRSLTGVHGAPIAPVAGDADLKFLYWGRNCDPATDAGCGPDGAHLTMVRVGTDTTCDISLESIFPNPNGDVEKVASYDFAALDEHIESIRALNTANVLWQVGYNPGRFGACNTDGSGTGVQLGEPLASFSESDRWRDVAINTLRHLNDGSNWDPNGHEYSVRFIEFMDDPTLRLGYSATTSLDELHLAYLNFANAVKARWPDKEDDLIPGKMNPTIWVGGISYEIADVSELEHVAETDKHPLFKFVDYTVDKGVPLDFVSFRTRTAHPHEAACIAGRIRNYLDSVGLDDTRLLAAAVDFDRDNPDLAATGVLDDASTESMYLGAFQAATRVFFMNPLAEATCKYNEEGPVHWMIAGRVPRVYSDLADHMGEDPASLQGIIVDSPYVEPDGTAKPAFMGLFPFRQVLGQQLVTVTKGNDAQGMAVLASHESSSGRTLHVIIANANVLTGNADITYDLRLHNFVTTAKQVEYKLAVLDRQASGVSSFHFSETGIIETEVGTGTIRFVHQMAVPSIHYVQFVKPN